MLRMYILGQINKVPTNLWAYLYYLVENSKMWL